MWVWSSDENSQAYQEETIEYVPLKRENRQLIIPIIKSIAAADSAFVIDTAERTYREIHEETDREETSEQYHL